MSLFDTQIRTLVRALHVYFDQSALWILCDVMPRISRSLFIQVVAAYAHFSVCFVPCYLRFASYHHNYYVLVCLYSIFVTVLPFYHSCTVLIFNLKSRISNMIGSNRQLAQNSVIYLACLIGKQSFVYSHSHIWILISIVYARWSIE